MPNISCYNITKVDAETAISVSESTLPTDADCASKNDSDETARGINSPLDDDLHVDRPYASHVLI